MKTWLIISVQLFCGGEVTSSLILVCSVELGLLLKEFTPLSSGSYFLSEKELVSDSEESYWPCKIWQIIRHMYQSFL